MSRPRDGVYRHWKGALYQVLGVAHDANADDLLSNNGGMGPDGSVLGERTVVVYFGLQLNAAHEGPRLAVRTLQDFAGYVHRSTGEECLSMRDLGRPGSGCAPYDCVERFRFAGPDFRAWMLEQPGVGTPCSGRDVEADFCQRPHGPDDRHTDGGPDTGFIPKAST